MKKRWELLNEELKEKLSKHHYNIEEARRIIGCGEQEFHRLIRCVITTHTKTHKEKVLTEEDLAKLHFILRVFDIFPSRRISNYAVLGALYDVLKAHDMDKYRFEYVDHLEQHIKRFE